MARERMSQVAEAPVGRFETLHYARTLARFWEQGFTGSFRARTNPRPGVTVTKEILFERGRVAWAASDDAEETIRAHLINRGHLRPDQWRLAEERSGSAQVRQTLLELGFLSARELQEADRERVTAITLSLFSWREGRWESVPSALPPGTPNLKVDPRDLVLEGLMSTGDRGRVLDEIGSLDAVLVVRPDDLVRASLSLPVELVGLMGKADGTRTIADICALSSLPDFLISAAFAGLKVLGLARPLDGPAGAALPAPPTAPPEGLSSRRAGAARSARALRGEAPRLPLDDDAETVPMATTPPGGTPATGARPAGQPEGRPRLRPTHDPTEPRMEPDSDIQLPDDEPVIRYAPEPLPPIAAAPGPAASTGTPSSAAAPIAHAGPAGRASAPAIAAAPGGPTPPPSLDPWASEEPQEIEDDEEAIVGEVELKPGIPVQDGPFDPSEARGLSDDEIDDVIQLFGAPPSPDAAAPSERGAGMSPPIRAESTVGTRDEEAGFDDEDPADAPDEDSPVTEEEAELDEGVNAPEAGEPPSWVYEPSGPPEGAPERKGWATWGALAAALFGLGAGLIFMFGTGGGPAEMTDAELDIAIDAPLDVRPPDAFSSGTASSGTTAAAEESESGPVASAALAEQPSPTLSNPAPRATQAPAARNPAPAAASPRPGPGGPVASPSSGNIFPSGPDAQGRRLLRQGDLGGAARRFEAALSGRSGLYTVQLAIACEAQTVTRAIGSTRDASPLFILPVTFQGRPCWRLLWGTYDGRTAAQRAIDTVPEIFRRDPHPPKVAPL